MSGNAHNESTSAKEQKNNRRLKLAILLLFSAVLIASSISLFFFIRKRGQFSLQRDCAKRADQFFKIKYPKSEDSAVVTINNYTNHYNYKLGRCLIKVDSEDFLANRNYELLSVSSSILDAVEGVTLFDYKSYPAYPKWGHCFVEGIKCQVDKEDLKGKYMKE